MNPNTAAHGTKQESKHGNKQGNKQGQHGHVPVMRDRMVEYVGLGVHAPQAPQHPVIIDGTLGAGGHTEAFLEAFPTATVIGFDRDANALAQAHERLARFGNRFCSYHARFDAVDEAIETLVKEGKLNPSITETGISGFLYDLGVSSMQLDQTERGFAYAVDAPLDMRMDSRLDFTAADILNTYSHGDLARVLKTYGEERFAGKIASAILREREKEPFTTSARLVELLYATIPAATRRTGGHPAKRTFQALRIEVNSELQALEHVIGQVMRWLHTGGVGVFMSYQSLEDKIVKRELNHLCTSQTPPGLPMDIPGAEAQCEMLTRGAEKASESEIAENQRAAPVRVRAVRRISQRGATKFPLTAT